MNDIANQAEGGWPFPDTLPYDEKLLSYTLGLSSYSGSDSDPDETPERDHLRLVRQGNPLSWDDRPANSVSIGDYMDRWNNQVNIGTAFPNSPTPRCRSFKTLLWIRKGIERTTLSELKTIRLQLGQGRLLLPGL